jgi:hypothetical protein
MTTMVTPPDPSAWKSYTTSVVPPSHSTTRKHHMSMTITPTHSASRKVDHAVAVTQPDCPTRERHTPSKRIVPGQNNESSQHQNRHDNLCRIFHFSNLHIIVVYLLRIKYSMKILQSDKKTLTLRLFFCFIEFKLWLV